MPATPFETLTLSEAPLVEAPDGSDVHVLCGLAGGGMATFVLPPGAVAKAVTHRTVEEIWFITAGQGRMWRRSGDQEATVTLARGTALTIPLGTRFQFRCDSETPLEAVAVTMPPWPGEDEAVFVDGIWEATV